MSEPQRSTCLVCDRPPHIRGLCPRCYSEARTAIAEDVTTEEELVGRGLMLPPHSRKKVGPLMAALRRSRAGEVMAPAAVQIPAADKPAQPPVDSWAFVCVVGCDVKPELPR
jgi:hypothetical protein